MDSTNEKVQISVRGVLTHLANGVTRCVGDTGYNEERGSIQEKYNLTKAQVTRMFKDPMLKGKKTRIQAEDPFVLVNDLEDDEEIQGAQYGERSTASLARAADVSDGDTTENNTQSEGEPMFGEIN